MTDHGLLLCALLALREAEDALDLHSEPEFADDCTPRSTPEIRALAVVRNAIEKIEMSIPDPHEHCAHHPCGDCMENARLKVEDRYDDMRHGC